jgi:hypothetical protein
MSLSGSTNFTQNRNQIIIMAFQLIGCAGIGKTPSNEDMQLASNMLNCMVKAWITKGLHLWSKQEATLFLTQNVASYNLGSAPYAADVDNLNITELNGNFPSGSTVLTVLNTAGMANGNTIGIVLSDLSTFWTTISSLTSTTITLASGIPAQGAVNSAPVYTITTPMSLPMRLYNPRRANGVDTGNIASTLIETPMGELSYSEYMNLANKTVSGTPMECHFNPNLTNGTLYVWPRPNDCSYRINFTYERVLEDLDNITDNFDFPNEWLETLYYQLAVRLSKPFGKDERGQIIKQEAEAMLQNLLDWDNEVTSVKLQPMRQQGRWW